MCIPSYTPTHMHAHILCKRQLSLAKLCFLSSLSPLHNSVSFIYLRTLVLDIRKTVILDFGSQVVVYWVGWESECILRKI